MTLRIRTAAPGDAPLVVDLIRALAQYEKLAHEAIATPAQLDAALFGTPPKAHALIAEIDGEGIGFALYFFNFSTFLGKAGLYLEDLFVKPHVRGVGAGKALLAELARIAVANDCGRMEWSVLDWNTPSIEFYKALGARPMSDWTTYRLTGDALTRLAQTPSMRR
jgi:GNAT superfamily N-acetyltransferase